MGATLATVSSLLKEIYEPRLRRQINDDAVALKRIESSSEGVTSEVGGKYVAFAVHTRRNAGIGARNENELLPVPGQQGATQARVGLKYLYGGVELTGQTLKLANSNAQAFVSALDLEMNGLRIDLKKDLNRQVYGTGNGAIAVATAVSASGLTFTALNGTKHVQLDEQVDVILGTSITNPTPTVVASNRKVISVVKSTGVVTLDGANFAVAIGDVLVRTGNVNREWTGLGKIVSDTGSLYNIDPTNEPIWKATISHNSGTPRALSEGMMIGMVDEIRTLGAAQPTLILTSLGVRRSYFNLLSQQQTYVNTKEFTGGFKGLAFTTDGGEVLMISDVDAPDGWMYFINEKEIKQYRDADWSWMDEDGNKFQRKIGYDAYNAYLFQYSELGTHRRNAHGVIKDIIEPAAV